MTFTILSFLTNMLVDTLNEESEKGDVQQVLSGVLSGDGGIYEFCSTFPNLRVFLAFPNIRTKPSWYSKLRSTIIRSLHQFMETAPLNLQLLEDFNGDLDRDQIHFSLLSGIYYVKHLVDRALELMEQPPPDIKQRCILVF